MQALTLVDRLCVSATNTPWIDSVVGRVVVATPLCANSSSANCNDTGSKA